MVQLRAHGVLFVRAVERNGDNSLFTLHEDRFVIRHFYCLLSKVHQIPLFPLYCRRDERGISGFFASLERLAKENFFELVLSNILHGRSTDAGCGNQRRIQTFRDLTHRRRLCFKPSPASSAAIRIGVPKPSTTGTPSCSCSQSGLMCTGHWLMPIG